MKQLKISLPGNFGPALEKLAKKQRTTISKVVTELVARELDLETPTKGRPSSLSVIEMAWTRLRAATKSNLVADAAALLEQTATGSDLDTFIELFIQLKPPRQREVMATIATAIDALNALQSRPTKNRN